MELSDGVITIRTPVADDVDELEDAVRSSLPELAAFMSWATIEHDQADTLRWINNDDDTDEDRFVIVAPTGMVIGACGLNNFNEANRFANLGYWVRTSATGNGYATRAARLLARHGFDEHRLARIEILMSVENQASRRVAERVGAQHEGVLRRRLLLYGRQHDADLYSLVPGDMS